MGQLKQRETKWMNRVNEFKLKLTKLRQGSMNSISDWRKRRARRQSFNFTTSFQSSEMKVKWIHADWREWAINFSQFTFIQWNEWINWRNVTRMTSGFIPFHEVHSAFINYTPWIDLAKLNGMRMNDIITVF